MHKTRIRTNLRIFCLTIGVIMLMAGNVVKAKEFERPTAGHYFPNDIVDWSLEKYPDQKNNISTVPLAKRAILEGEGTDAKNSDGKVMALMIANKNTSGSPAQGGNDYRYSYAFTHWQYIDTAVYWGGSSGEGIIVPPSADFTDAAHRNGVKVIGTIFFPPEAYGGKFEWIDEFLQKDKEGNYILVDKLIKMADTLGFDGWFINAETSGTWDTPNQLQDFMKIYNEKTDKTLVWYDSMIQRGYVSWQGQLNEFNEQFLRKDGKDISDEFFVDFRWRSSYLDSSYDQAKKIGFDPLNIFYGVNVQGEENFNMNIRDAYSDIVKYMQEGNSKGSTSLGLYVPDAAMRINSGKEGMDFWESTWKDEQLLWINRTGKLGENTGNGWSGVSNYYKEKTPITSLPFTSSFNQGAGDNFYIDGKLAKKGEFINRSTQDIMPTFRWLYENYGGNNLVPSFDLETVYYGGSSLKLSGTFEKDGTTENLLFGSKITIGENMKALIVKKGNAKVDLVFVEENGNKIVVEGKENKDEWDTVEYDLSKYNDKQIKKIGVKVTTTDPSVEKINIGKISIGETKENISITKFDVQQKEVRSGFIAKINFNIESSDENGQKTNVYIESQTGEKILVGTTNNNTLFVDNVYRPEGDKSVVKFVAIPVDSNNKEIVDGSKMLEFDFGNLEKPTSDFISDKSFIKVGEEVKFTSKSSLSTSFVEWYIPGAKQEKSTDKEFTTTFEKSGKYTVQLTAKNKAGENVVKKENFVVVYKDEYKIENVALMENKKVEVSGECNLSEAGDLAFDDNIRTKWCDNGHDHPWLKLTLPEKVTITGFKLYNASEGAEDVAFNTRNYTIEVSENGEDWEKVVDVKNNKSGISSSAVLTSGKYIRLNIETGEQSGRVARIYEFKILGFKGDIKGIEEYKPEETLPQEDTKLKDIEAQIRKLENLKKDHIEHFVKKLSEKEGKENPEKVLELAKKADENMKYYKTMTAPEKKKMNPIEEPIMAGYFRTWHDKYASLEETMPNQFGDIPSEVDIAFVFANETPEYTLFWRKLAEEYVPKLNEQGTRVVRTVGAKMLVEDIDGNKFDNTQAGNKARAEYLVKNLVDKYGLDGLDIDIELENTMWRSEEGKFEQAKAVIEEISKLIGPKSGTDKLFIVDTNLTGSDEILKTTYDKINYLMFQAYGGNTTTLDSAWKTFISKDLGENKLNSNKFVPGFTFYEERDTHNWKDIVDGVEGSEASRYAAWQTTVGEKGGIFSYAIDRDGVQYGNDKIVKTDYNWTKELDVILKESSRKQRAIINLVAEYNKYNKIKNNGKDYEKESFGNLVKEASKAYTLIKNKVNTTYQDLENSVQIMREAFKNLKDKYEPARDKAKQRLEALGLRNDISDKAINEAKDFESINEVVESYVDTLTKPLKDELNSLKGLRDKSSEEIKTEIDSLSELADLLLQSDKFTRDDLKEKEDAVRDLTLKALKEIQTNLEKQQSELEKSLKEKDEKINELDEKSKELQNQKELKEKEIVELEKLAEEREKEAKAEAERIQKELEKVKSEQAEVEKSKKDAEENLNKKIKELEEKLSEQSKKKTPSIPLVPLTPATKEVAKSGENGNKGRDVLPENKEYTLVLENINKTLAEVSKDLYDVLSEEYKGGFESEIKEIHFVNKAGEKVIKFNSPMEVSIELKSLKLTDKDALRVFHLTENGFEEIKDVKVDGQKVMFKSASFSPFVFVKGDKVVEFSSDDKQKDENTQNGYKGNNSQEQGSKGLMQNNSQNTNPITGDSGILLFVILGGAAVLLFAAILIFRKSNKK
ncbi:EndoS/ChiA family endoglycosidase [Helcococcus bovis]|uniref:EndoS/ChiA family endoglycosidase n=1 Tax=Helcococcus bovis TaxID=3153252 RepID=UPI0038B99B7A